MVKESPHMSEEGYEQMYVKETFDTNWIALLALKIAAVGEEDVVMVV